MNKQIIDNVCKNRLLKYINTYYFYAFFRSLWRTGVIKCLMLNIKSAKFGILANVSNFERHVKQSKKYKKTTILDKGDKKRWTIFNKDEHC